MAILHEGHPLDVQWRLGDVAVKVALVDRWLMDAHWVDIHSLIVMLLFVWGWPVVEFVGKWIQTTLPLQSIIIYWSTKKVLSLANWQDWSLKVQAVWSGPCVLARILVEMLHQIAKSPKAFQSTPSSQVPKKWEGGMNEAPKCTGRTQAFERGDTEW